MLRAGALNVDQLRKIVPVIDQPARPVPDAGDVKPAEPHPLRAAGEDAGTGP
jgi:hypothetical protein